MSKNDDFVKACEGMSFPPAPPLDFPETPAIDFPADAPQDVTPQATAERFAAAMNARRESSVPWLICDKAVPDLSKLPTCVMSNEEILDRAYSSISPDALCWGEDNGKIVGGLWDIAEEVGTAMKNGDAESWIGEQLGQIGQRGQILYALRAFYQLGFQRGLEAYRDHLLDNGDEPAFAELPFELEPLAAGDFANDLNEEPSDLLDKLLALVGVSGPAADGKEAR